VPFAALAPLGFAAGGSRRQAAFHALVVVLFSALAVEGPILRLYLALPMGRIFRLPARFLWVASFGACMLTGLGVDAVARPAHRWRVELPVLAVLGPGPVWLLPRAGPRPRPELW